MLKRSPVSFGSGGSGSDNIWNRRVEAAVSFCRSWTRSCGRTCGTPGTACSLETTWRPGSSGQNRTTAVRTGPPSRWFLLILDPPGPARSWSASDPPAPPLQLSAASVRPGGPKHRHGHAPPPHLDLSGADPRRPGERRRREHETNPPPKKKQVKLLKSYFFFISLQSKVRKK